MSVPAYHPHMVKVMGSGPNLGGPTQLMDMGRGSQVGMGAYVNNSSTVNVKMHMDSKRGNIES